MAEGMMGWLQEHAAGAGNWAKDKWKGLRGSVSNLTPGSVGAAAGEAVNAAEGAVDATKKAAGEAAEGYKRTRGVKQPKMSIQDWPANSGPQKPPPGMLARGARAGLDFLSKPGTTAAALAIPAAIGVADEAQKQMGQSGLVAAANNTDGSFGVGGEVSPRTQNRIDRLQGLLNSGLRAIDPRNLIPNEEAIGNLLAGATDIRGPATRGVQMPKGPRPESGSIPSATPAPSAATAGVVPNPNEVVGPVDPREKFRTGMRDVDPSQWQRAGEGNETVPAFVPVGNPDLGPRQTQQFEVPRGGILIHNNQTGVTTAHQQTNPERAISNEVELMRAARDADNEVRLAYGGGRGGLRGGAPSGRGGKFQDAFDALSRLHGYGAATRLAKNKADVGLRKATLANDVAKANLQANFKSQELQQKDRELDIKGGELGTKIAKERREAETAGATRAEDRIKSLGIELAGERRKGTLLGKDESDEDLKRRTELTTADLRNDINATLDNRKDGKKIGDLSNAELGQLALLKKFKDSINNSRSGMSQKLRDFFGTKRFNSRDLYSYAPAKVEKGTLPGSYVVHFGNGNTAEVGALAGGGFNWLGPNEPVDRDMLSMILPHIEKLEGKKR